EGTACGLGHFPTENADEHHGSISTFTCLPGTYMTIQARAAVIERKNDAFVMHDVSVEDPRPDEVLVRMVATGICATDAHVRQQLLPTPLPAILGHEGAGIVERVGSTVTHLKPGDHVVLSYHSC